MGGSKCRGIVSSKKKIIVFILFSGIWSWALTTGVLAKENNLKYTYYFQFTEPTVSRPNFKNPIEMVSLTAQTVAKPRNSFSLLVWTLVSRMLPIPNETYDRKKHFGDWIIDDRNGNCMNTRSVVLKRDSLTNVGMDPVNRCSVENGTWDDPYSNLRLTTAKSIQIDHVVPLKHAYIAGGFQWDAKLKCLYANYLGYRNHLLAVLSVENMRKSDATPFSYLPPNKAYICSYLANWLKIKKIWNLALIPPEVQAIGEAFKENGCSAEQFNMDFAELIQQRQYIIDNHHMCDYMRRSI
jgi:hypothetical protein